MNEPFKGETMPTTPKFRIDIDMHDLLMGSAAGPQPPKAQGLTLPEPVFPQYPELLQDPGPQKPPENRKWSASHIYRATRGRLFPYVRSRVL